MAARFSTGSRSTCTMSRHGVRIGYLAIVLTVAVCIFVQAHTETTQKGAQQQEEQSNGRLFNDDETRFQDEVRRCNFDSFFTEHERECVSVRKQQISVLKSCTDQKYRRRHEDVCNAMKYYTQTQQARCNGDDVFAMLQEMSCRNLKEHTLGLAKECQEQLKDRQYEVLCEDNRIYGVEILEGKCTEPQFHEEHQKLCTNVRVAMQLQAQQCMNDEYFAKHEMACEYFFYYLRRTRHRCATDVGFRTQHEQACKVPEDHTEVEEDKCTRDVDYYNKNKTDCADTEHYYSMQEHAKCVDNTQYFNRFEQHCTSHIRRAQHVAALCDEPSHYTRHMMACDAQRFYVQMLQQKCNDNTFYSEHEGACMVQRDTTQGMHKGCEESDYRREHETSCRDTKHNYVQMVMQKCNAPKFYEQSTQECRDAQRVQNVILLERCQDTTYHGMHNQACEAQRYLTQKQRNSCKEQEYAREHQVCQDVMATTQEQQGRCEKTEYYTQHQETCQDVQQQHQEYIQIVNPRMTFDRLYPSSVYRSRMEMMLRHILERMTPSERREILRDMITEDRREMMERIAIREMLHHMTPHERGQIVDRIIPYGVREIHQLPFQRTFGRDAPFQADTRIPFETNRYVPLEKTEFEMNHHVPFVRERIPFEMENDKRQAYGNEGYSVNAFGAHHGRDMFYQHRNMESMAERAEMMEQLEDQYRRMFPFSSFMRMTESSEENEDLSKLDDLAHTVTKAATKTIEKSVHEIAEEIERNHMRRAAGGL